MTIAAIVQARMSSTRLPGKVMKPILGKPMLAYQIERLKRAHSISNLIIATSTQPEDTVIADLAATLGVDCFRGSLSDVLDRYVGAARTVNPDHVLRTTADCPIIDPDVLDSVCALHVADNADYTTNNMPPSWPHGLDLEVIRMDCLEQAWRESESPYDREHVTPFIRERPSRFKIANFASPKDFSYHRWTVDEPEDFELAQQIYEGLYPSSPKFSTRDVLDFLGVHPEISALNRKFAHSSPAR